MKDLGLCILGAIVIEDMPMVFHEARESLLELGIDHDFLECTDDLVELEVFC